MMISIARMGAAGRAAILGLLAGPAISAAEAMEVGSVNLSKEAVLFAFDDRSIAATDNLQLSMETPEKYPGNPLLSFGRPGEPDEWQFHTYCTLLRQGGKFKMWYHAMAREGFINPLHGGNIAVQGNNFAYAESPDGIHWTKPNLGLVYFRGNRNNNLIQMPKGFHGYFTLVRYEPEEPDPSRRFKMMALLNSWGDYVVPDLPPTNSFNSVKIFLPLYSADGIRWRVADELVAENKRIISPKFHLVEHVEGSGLYKWKGMYYLTGQNGPDGSKAAMPPYGRHVQIFHSPDLLNWSVTQTMGLARQGQYRRPSRITERTDDGGQGPPIGNEQTHAGLSAWNRGNVLIGITGLWHGASDWINVTHDLGFMISNDGLHFREPQPDFVFAQTGEDGRDWDHGGLQQGEGFENVGEKTYIWYSQYDQRDGPRTGRPWPREGGVGLLVLDRDRFGSLSTRDPNLDGTLISTEIQSGWPMKLFVNAEGLGPDSPLRIEVLNREERPIPGYSGRDAATLQHSGLRVPVSWKGSEGIALPNEPIKIQFHFEGPERNAIRLYAIYVTP